ncbi:MAG: hypothetical protein KAU50_06695 [Candidatus Marinimicrobia bacterium]|nr:hypothetical protein [Candidatus Neomarinimicrobiota bacterium]
MTTRKKSQPRRLLRSWQVMEMLSIRSRTTLYNWKKSGRLLPAGITATGQYLYDPADVEKMRIIF